MLNSRPRRDRTSIMLLPAKITLSIAHGDILTAAGLIAVLGRYEEFELVAQQQSADVIVADYESGLRIAHAARPKRRRVLILTHNNSEVEICYALEQGIRGYVFLGGSIDELRLSLKQVHRGEVALGCGVASRIAGRLQGKALTRRETEVLGYVMGGMSNKAIAVQLTLAVGTIKTHVKSILEKLDARTRTQAASIAQRRGMLRGEEFVPGDGFPSGRPRNVATRAANDAPSCLLDGMTERSEKLVRQTRQRGDL
jgi:DNA-binding NarL/FixJ family response regulator